MGLVLCYLLPMHYVISSSSCSGYIISPTLMIRKLKSREVKSLPYSGLHNKETTEQDLNPGGLAPKAVLLITVPHYWLKIPFLPLLPEAL